MIERGQKHLAVDYNRALDQVDDLNRSLREIFADYDVILTPATTGTAPRGLESTGSPIFCTLWTLAGVPAITLPLLKASTACPLACNLLRPRAMTRVCCARPVACQTSDAPANFLITSIGAGIADEASRLSGATRITRNGLAPGERSR